MNTIRGKVLVRETGTGVADLVIVVYDLDPREPPEEIFASLDGSKGADLWTRIRGERLGSVATGPDGSFNLTYEDAEFRGRTCERRPDLLLLVTAPEGRHAEACPEVLHVSCGIRQNAGRNEYYLIHLTRERLRKAGIQTISTEDDPEDPDVMLARLKLAAAREEAIRRGLREVAVQRVAFERERRAEQKKLFADPARLLSAVPERIRETDNYVAPGDSVETNTFRVIQRGIESQINTDQNPVRKVGVLSLSPQQRAALTDPQGNLRRGVLASDLTPLLNGPVLATPFLPTDLIRVGPLYFCRDQRDPDLRCPPPPADGPAPGGGGGAPGGGGAGGSGTAPPADGNLAVAGVPRFIARLVETMTSPETTVRLEEGTRATAGDVQGQIDRLELRGGPADTPAFHDFHQLQIAFEHVWMEAFNADMLDLMRQTYQQIEELGGNPGAAFADASDPPQTLLEEAGLVAGTTSSPSGAAAGPLPAVAEVFQISDEQWNALPLGHQTELTSLATAYKNASEQNVSPDAAAIIAMLRAAVQSVDSDNRDLQDLLSNLLYDAIGAAGTASSGQRPDIRSLQRFGENIIHYADQKVGTDRGYLRLHKLLQELRKRLFERYAFTIYAATKEQRSVNFGVLVTYRQKWEPLSYQAGELVKTIPLAPKETRKYTKKVVIKRRRAEKEVTNSLRSRRDEETQTRRIEAEIVERAASKTNFGMTAEGGFTIGVANASGTTNLAAEASTASDDTKKQFREAVLKAAEEVKQERTVEVNTETSDDTEAEESGEISNPNEEIPVTFLFYELQRRYRVSERIHRARPVILVAQEVPYPHEIDEDWLVAHDWILRRVILDDSFVPALAYLSARVVGDEVALSELRKNVEQQRRLVADISEDVAAYREQTGKRYAALERSVQRHVEAVEKEEDDGGFLEGLLGVATGGLSTLFGGADGQSAEGGRLREDATRDAYEQATKEERDLRARLEREVSALTSMTEAYTKALSEHLNRKAQIERLKVHVKQNILYYIQAIWNHEPPDQRFFRLHTVRVPRFTGQVRYDLSNAPNNTAAYPNWNTPAVQVEASCRITLPLEFATLAEVADLDNLLGYKGNYMIFPLREPNRLTDFMMTPYIDAALGLRDPDEMGNWTLDEFVEYVCCLQRHMNRDAFNPLRDGLRDQFRRLLSAPRRDVEEIVVPTGSLFIEALPGAHPILEDFKLKHRAMDVKRVQADVRRIELENLRLVARLLTDEYEDPEIERKIVIEGSGQNVLVGGDN